MYDLDVCLQVFATCLALAGVLPSEIFCKTSKALRSTVIQSRSPWWSWQTLVCIGALAIMPAAKYSCLTLLIRLNWTQETVGMRFNALPTILFPPEQRCATVVFFLCQRVTPFEWGCMSGLWLLHSMLAGFWVLLPCSYFFHFELSTNPWTDKHACRLRLPLGSDMCSVCFPAQNVFYEMPVFPVAIP